MNFLDCQNILKGIVKNESSYNTLSKQTNMLLEYEYVIKIFIKFIKKKKIRIMMKSKRLFPTLKINSKQ